MTKPEKVTPIFPAAAIARYVNPACKEIDVSDLEFTLNYSSTSKSTDQDTNILELPRFADLAAFLKDCVKDYLDNVVCYQYKDFAIVHSWVNKTQNGGYQRLHYHGNSIVSGCYYLQANRESAPIIFEKMEMNSQPYLAIAPKQQTIFTANRIAFAVETGTCYMFPSNIKHGYETENKGGERLSLAFNVMLNGIGLSYKI